MMTFMIQMISRTSIFLIFSLTVLIVLSFGIAPRSAHSANRDNTFTPSCGKASWYALTSLTANGERSDPEGMTAAHKKLAFGTMVRVTNFGNGRSIILRINDRGPFIKGRIIDVTRSAAAKLGFKNRGWAQVGVSPVNVRANTGAKGRKCQFGNAYELPTPEKLPLPKKRPTV